MSYERIAARWAGKRPKAFVNDYCQRDVNIYQDKYYFCHRNQTEIDMV